MEEFTQHEIEYQHRKGKIPDWVYYQLSDKPVWMKMEEQRARAYQKMMALQNEREEEQIIERFVPTIKFIGEIK